MSQKTPIIRKKDILLIPYNNDGKNGKAGLLDEGKIREVRPKNPPLIQKTLLIRKIRKQRKKVSKQTILVSN